MGAEGKVSEITVRNQNQTVIIFPPTAKPTSLTARGVLPAGACLGSQSPPGENRREVVGSSTCHIEPTDFRLGWDRTIWGMALSMPAAGSATDQLRVNDTTFLNLSFKAGK